MWVEAVFFSFCCIGVLCFSELQPVRLVGFDANGLFGDPLLDVGLSSGVALPSTWIWPNWVWACGERIILWFVKREETWWSFLGRVQYGAIAIWNGYLWCRVRVFWHFTCRCHSCWSSWIVRVSVRVRGRVHYSVSLISHHLNYTLRFHKSRIPFMGSPMTPSSVALQLFAPAVLSLIMELLVTVRL